MADDTLNASSHVVEEANEAASANLLHAGGSVALEDIKAIGGGLAFYANLAAANSVANQQAMNQIGQASTAKGVQMIYETDVSEAAGGVLMASLLTQPSQKPSVTQP